MSDEPEPSNRLLTSRGEFHQALRLAFGEAARGGCRELFISDTDFSDWPLGEVAVVDDLTHWARSHRRLTVLAQRYDDVTRRHPRWVVWRRQWSHVVTCRALEAAEPGEVPTLLLAPGRVTVRLVDTVHYGSSVSRLAEDAVLAKERLDALLQRSSDAFPASVLGL